MFYYYRILAYSPASIVNVTVEVDDVYLGLAQHSGGALYVIQWESDKYARGQHKITVQVKVRILLHICVTLKYVCIYVALKLTKMDYIVF